MITALLVVLVAIAYIGPCIYVAATLTRAKRQPVQIDPRAFGLQVEDVTFPSAVDGVRLRGWLLYGPDAPPTGGRLIVLVHGHNGVRDDSGIGIVPLAAELVRAGYPVLTFDLRGHGESAGDRFSLGWYERRDLRGALDWAEGRGFTQVGVQGFSMGAATALLTAAEDRRIAALVTDSSFASLREILAVEAPKRSGLPRLYTPGVLLMVRLLYGPDANALRPAEAIAGLGDRPVLILHGADDRLIPATNAERLWTARYGQAGEDNRDRLHIFPGAAHVKAYQTDPTTYRRLVLDFWRTALP